MKKKVLLLGAAGNIGSNFVDEYEKKYKTNYDLILGIHKGSLKRRGFKVIKFKLENLSSLRKTMSGVHTVINLAANPDPSAEFSALVKPNLIGAYNVFEAARQAKVKRVVFASSVHAIKGYPDNHKVIDGEAPKPLNFYGATKVFAEALCNVFSQKGLSCLAIRIGAYVSDDQRKVVCLARENYDYVISQRDMGQLLHKSIQAPARVKFGILAGISNNRKKKFDLSCTRKLINYKPQDDAFSLCDIVKKHVGAK